MPNEFNIKNGFISNSDSRIIGGLTASTISATTYLNLPTDIRVTGGTYSNSTGIATFSNNTGGTFNVTGFTTGFTASDYVCQGYLSTNQSIPTGVDTVIQFIDDFDPQNWWNSSTYRFQPTISGYYNITLSVFWQTATVANNQYNSQIRKNGNQIFIWQNQTTTNAGVSQGNTKIVYFNGTTDYVEFTGFNGDPTSRNIEGGSNRSTSYFSAALLAGGTSSSSGGSGSVFTGGTITGPTNFTAGLTANTISTTTVSATTYQNLPIDIRVTGGTYSNSTGIATFTNNTGGTFSVTGFSTSTATAFTGGTVTGATNFTGGLTASTISATTISATTYQNLPPDLWTQNGSSIYYNTGNVGIGESNPTRKFEVLDGTGLAYFNLTGTSGPAAVVVTTDLTKLTRFIASDGTNSINVGMRTSGETANPGFGGQNDAFIYVNTSANGLNIINAAGTGNGDYIRLYAGITANQGPSHLHVQGSGATKGFIGINTENPIARLHVSGNTLISGSLSATTISATTYLNLPTDIRVTGGTYNSGTATFTNNTGGTFDVTGVTSSLQEAYTASTAPRITTNNTLGSFRIRGGTGSDSDNNFIIENNLGDVTSYWDANGDLVLNTISATTYYNLPTDIRVTGGSYNQISGVATFTNNTGGTFTVDGFSTGSDEFFTGGTVTGPANFIAGITASTISATTYYNLPTDIRVTGGTYSNGITTFRNNTGGTFNVTGFFTGSTDVYVTGGTYSNGITTFRNITGGTFNVSSTTNYAAGVISGSTGWSSTGTGQINLPSVNVALYNNSNNIEPLLIYTVASGTTNSGGIPSLYNTDTNYIVIEYNGGSPIYNVYTDDSLVNNSSVVLFMVVYRANNFIHTLEFGNQGAGLVNKLNDRFIKTNRFGYESGLSLSLSGVTGVVNLSAGVAWNGSNRQSLAAINSQDDVFFKNFHSGGTWTYTTTGDTLNNTHYDNGTNIVNATAGKYLVNWYFRGQEINDHLYEVYSTNEYDSVALAQLSTEPSLPELVTSHAILLGRIIVQVSATTGLTESAFVNVFQSTNVTSHNDLTALQGGSAGQYYHLNANQFNNIALTNTNNNFSVSQTFNSGVVSNSISATTISADSATIVTISATTITGDTLYGDGSNITNIPIPYGIINAISSGNFLT